MRFSSPFVFLLLTMGLLTLGGTTGCGEATSAKAPVTGKVTYNGEPVTAGTVVFAPLQATGEIGSGEVGADGTFKVSTLEPGDGAPIGLARVSYKPPIAATEPPEDWDSSKGDPPREKSPYEGLIPKQQEFEIKDGANEIVIELMPMPQPESGE